MINSVSKMSFGSSIGAMDKVSQEQMYNPGLYAMPELMEQPHHHNKKDGGFLGFLGKLILTALVVGAASIGIRKVLMKNYNAVEKLPDSASNSAKFTNWFAKWTDKLYDATVGKFFTWAENYRIKHPKHNTTSANNANANTNANTDNKS